MGACATHDKDPANCEYARLGTRVISAISSKFQIPSDEISKRTRSREFRVSMKFCMHAEWRRRGISSRSLFAAYSRRVDACIESALAAKPRRHLTNFSCPNFASKSISQLCIPSLENQSLARDLTFFGCLGQRRVTYGCVAPGDGPRGVFLNEAEHNASVPRKMGKCPERLKNAGNKSPFHKSTVKCVSLKAIGGNNFPGVKESGGKEGGRAQRAAGE